MNKQICHTLASGVLGVALLTMSTMSQAALHLSLAAGQSPGSHAGYNVMKSQSASASVGVDLGQNFRVAYTLKQSKQSSSGYAMQSGTTDCLDSSKCDNYESQMRILAQSVDLSLILFNGEVLTPFISAGLGVKKYTGETTQGSVTTEISTPSIPAPQAGIGLALRLNRDFSLKLTETFSQGYTLEPGSATQTSTIDGEFEMGITYRLH